MTDRNNWRLCQNKQLVARVARADGWLAKGVGVLGFRSLPPRVGLWLPGVAAVHTLFVRFPLDLLFLDADFRAVKILLSVPPGRFLVRASGGRHVVELGAGTLTGGERAGEAWKLERLSDSAIAV